MPKFLRRDCTRFAMFGYGKGKNAKWRSPKGRHNKMRDKKRGYPAVVSIGYSTSKKEKGKINAKTPILVSNLNDLKKVEKENIIILGKMGTKKRIQILEKAKEMKVEVYKINVQKRLDKLKGAKKDESKK
jgi:large subunit ribosomal protein L32e